jgi:hypothetical protein
MGPRRASELSFLHDFQSPLYQRAGIRLTNRIAQRYGIFQMFDYFSITLDPTVHAGLLATV